MSSIVLGDLEFELRRSSRRNTVGIAVDRDGQLVLSTPQSVSMKELEHIVNRKKTWIYTKLSEKEPMIHPSHQRKYISGEGFFYLGRSYRLKLVDGIGDQPKLRMNHGWFELNRGSQSEGRGLFVGWYTSQLYPVLKRYLGRLAPRIPVDYRSARIRDLGYKWGSCGKNRDLFFHWRVAMLPHRQIEYVVTHELVHLIEPRHNRAFWNRVEVVLPDCAERVSWLAINGLEHDL